MTIVLHLFLVALLLNLVWEFSHCWLYLTCRRQSRRQNVRLLSVMATKDAGLIVLFYLLADVVSRAAGADGGPARFGLFLVLCLGFSFVDERVSVARGRWEYAPAMPTVLGVGVTPLLELAVTGAAAITMVT